MSRQKKLEDNTFGNWYVAEYLGGSYYNCKCTNCGKERKIYSTHLENGRLPKCECDELSQEKKSEAVKMMNHERRERLETKTIGNWYVEEYTRRGYYKCKCLKCKNEREIGAHYLKTNTYPQCECEKNKDGKGGTFTPIKYTLSNGEVVESKKFQGKDKLFNQDFGEWHVIDYIGDKYWVCKCSCNKISKLHGYKLRTGMSMSCGHSKNEFIDLKDQQFGEWTVRKYLGNHQWECECSCGAIKSVSSVYLRNGSSKSCGHATTGLKELTGQQFNEWTALYRNTDVTWKCRCSCGEEHNVKINDLLKGYSKSCGHSSNKFIDLKGKQFGEWAVLKYLGNQMWLCKCSCGTLRAINGKRLRLQRTHSCGCKALEFASITMQTKYGTKPFVIASAEQRKSVESREALISTINQLFGSKKPTVLELEQAIGWRSHGLYPIIKKFGIGSEYLTLTSFTSKYETEILDIIKCGEQSNRSVLNGKEIDIYISEKNLGIEFNGTYWHSTVFKDKKYHQNKTLLALTKNTSLIHIFEYEWLEGDTKEKLINLLNSRIHPENNTKIQARECEITEVNGVDALLFEEKYHLQNSAASSINIGLKYNNELVGLMTFGKPRFNSEYEYELIRLCYMSNTVIIGGAEKMFKHFLDTYKPTSIISYCDMSKFSGQVYKNLGFRLDGITEPNYKWVKVDNNTVLTRYQTQKQKLVDKGLGTENQTEDEIMEYLDFYKVYDCGNYRFVWEEK